MTKKQAQLTGARAIALATLDKVRTSGAYSNLQLNQALESGQLSGADRRLVTALVYGTLQHQRTLDYWLSPFIAGKKVRPWVKTLLLMTLFQYQYLDRVPNFAATDEAIEIAKRRGGPGVRRFVTGVLHAILRNGVADVEKIEDPKQRLAIQASLPDWLVDELVAQYGLAQTEALAKVINEPARISLRVNRAKATVEEAQALLRSAGVETKPSEVAQNGLVVTKGAVLKTAAFKNGVVTIQDESAMLAVESMHLTGHERVLDACAAPGGKTVQIAEALTDGEVYALDIHRHKVGLIEKNAQRMGVDDRVFARQLDARQVGQEFADQFFDQILVDAPCSGMGLLRRKPEIRYDKQLGDSQRLHQIQGAILDSVATKVKKGGIITYSTCTILRQENDETVAEFLKHHPNFRLQKTTTARMLKDNRQAQTLTLLPSDYGSDGFFISNLQRVQ